MFSSVGDFPISAVLHTIDLLEAFAEEIVGDFLKGKADGVDFFVRVEGIEGGGEFDVAFDHTG